jgi:hypothetical protein
MRAYLISSLRGPNISKFMFMHLINMRAWSISYWGNYSFRYIIYYLSDLHYIDINNYLYNVYLNIRFYIIQPFKERINRVGLHNIKLKKLWKFLVIKYKVQ